MRLKELFELRNGYTPSKNNPEFWEGGTIPWFRMEDIRKNGRILSDSIQHITPEAVKTAGLFEANSFIVATTATIGEHAWLIADSQANQQFTNLKVRKSLIKRIALGYIFYLLFYVDDECKKNTRTTTFPAVNMNDFKNIELHIPSISEQEAIAAYLDRECEKIGQQIELLERKADAYKRLHRSIINRAVTRGINPNAPLKPLGIPWIDSIPEHWDIKRGKSIFQEVYRDVRPEDGTVTCFRDGEVTLRTNRRTTGFTESDKEIGYHGVRVGDLVIHQMDAFAGSIGVSDSNGKCSPICIVCRPLHEDETDLGYYCQLLRVMAHSGFIQSLAKGIRERTTDFRYKTLVTLHFPVPPYIEQQQIAAYLDEKCGKIDAIIEKIDTKVERLKELKRSLINEVVTGKRAIKNI